MADQELQSLVARLRANVSEMRRGFEQMADKAYQTTQKIGASFDLLGQKVQQIGRTMVLSITVPFATLVGFSIKAASDVEEMQNLISVTFGDAADSVREWAEVTAKSVGRSRFALLEAASDFAAFLKPLGVAAERVVPMSKALAQLTTDIASFRQMSDAEVAVKLFSGISGQTEAVRRLGIDIGEAAVKAELLRLGFQGNPSAASQAMKAQAIYNLMIKDSKDAMGDAMATIASYENQVKGLGATIRDVRVEIGLDFIPTATELVAMLNILGRRVLELSDAQRTNALMWGIGAAAIGPFLLVLGGLVRIIGFSVAGLGSLARASVQAFAMMGRAALAVVAPIFSIPAAILATVTALIGFRNTVGAVFKSIVQFAEDLGLPITEPIRQAFEFLQDTGLKVWEFFRGIMEKVAKQYNRFIDSIEYFTSVELTKLFVEPYEVAKGKLDAFVADLPEFNTDRIKHAFAKDLDAIKQTFQKVMNQIKGIVPELDMSLFEGLSEEADAEIEATKKAYMDLFKIFDDFGSAAGDTIDDARLNAKDLAEDLRQAFIGRLSDINSMGDAMSAVLDRLKAQLLEIAFFGTDGSGGLFGGIFNSIAGTFAGFFGGGKAAGGPVSAGTGYIVGEKGPEWFQPRSAGTIVPAQQTAQMGRGRGDIIVNQEINLPPDNAELTERMSIIGAAFRDQAISAFRQAQNAGF